VAEKLFLISLLHHKEERKNGGFQVQNYDEKVK
jgi:hypothetical protein